MNLLSKFTQFGHGNGCDTGDSITTYFYLGKECVYVWPVADLDQKPGGTKSFNKTPKEDRSVEGPQPSF